MNHQALIDTILAPIRAWDPLHGPLDWSDDAFNALAKKIFEFQYENNVSYQKYCQKQSISPKNLQNYRQIPAVPTDVFKFVELTTAADPARIFRTSGTTLGERGAHRFGTLAVYEAALVAPFKRFCLPDVDQIRMLVLAPSSADLSDSSLSFMISELMQRFGDPQSDYFVRADAHGNLTTHFDELRRALDQAQADGVPTMLLGTSFAYVEFFDSCTQSWQLAPSSRLMDTGGFKGRTREISRDDLYELFQTRLGIVSDHVVSEYSMTELSSQAYTDNLFFSKSDKLLKNNRISTSQHGARHRVGAFQTPPWVRVELVDPHDFSPIDASATPGLIRWYDLANTESVLAVQTSDLGEYVDGGGFRLLGRAPEAELRGCSLTIEEIVDAAQ